MSEIEKVCKIISEVINDETLGDDIARGKVLAYRLYGIEDPAVVFKREEENKKIKERKEKEEREEKERQEKCRREQAETDSIHRKFAIAFLIVTFTPISYYFFS